ncbi:MAG: hypothetical protein WDN01_18225 [Rhizomicrobium sp.]
MISPCRRLSVLFALTAATVAVGPAMAARLVIPEDKPVFYNAYASPEIAQPWASRQPDTRLTERPIGELIAVKLGLADGHAELFRYHVDNAPSDKTMLDGVIDGGGVKLKLTW